VEIDEAWIKEVAQTLPELPEAKKERFEREYDIPSYDAQFLTSSVELADYYEDCCKSFHQPKPVSNWIMVELMRELNRDNLDISSSPIKPKSLADLLKMLDDGIISGKIAKSVFVKMYKTGKEASRIIKEENLVQITDESELEQTIDRVLDENPGPVTDYKSGKKQAVGFLVGQVMKFTKGKANPKLVNRILMKKLDK
jgi:aspartyl-tRNA(Asn)/glutamyl-tRNA(Gln) amidotransferase subunit B